MRVVSVLPSATEIVCALGHADLLVGRSAECDYPGEVHRLPIVMWPRTLDADRSSAEIDGRVRDARARNESLYFLDVDRLRELRPDLLLTQDLCSVCSVTSEEVTEACGRAGVAPRVVSLVPRTLGEVWDSFPVVGAALGDSSTGEALADTSRSRVTLPALPNGPRRRVAVVEWLDPPILAGLWSSDMIRAAGAEPIGPGAGDPAERLSWPRLAERAPDLLVLSPCSFPVSRSLQELEDRRIARGVALVDPPLGTYVADEAYFSRPGPRLADGVSLLRGLLAGDMRGAPMPVVRWTASPDPLVNP